MQDDSAPSNGETRTPSGADPLLSCLLASYRQRGYAPLGMAAEDEATGRLRNEAGTLLIRCVSAEGESPVAAGEVARFQQQIAAEPGAATGLLASRHGFDDEAWRFAADHPTLRLLDRPALESMLGPIPELFSASVPPPLPLPEAPETVPPAGLRRSFLQRLAGGRQRPRLVLAAAIPLLLVLTVWGYPAYLTSQVRQAQAQAEAAARQPRFAERPATAAQAETDSAKKERLTGVWIPRPLQPPPPPPATNPRPASAQPTPELVELTRSNVWTEQELAEWQRRQEESIRTLERTDAVTGSTK